MNEEKMISGVDIHNVLLPYINLFYQSNVFCYENSSNVFRFCKINFSYLFLNSLNRTECIDGVQYADSIHISETTQWPVKEKYQLSNGFETVINSTDIIAAESDPEQVLTLARELDGYKKPYFIIYQDGNGHCCLYTNIKSAIRNTPLRTVS